MIKANKSNLIARAKQLLGHEWTPDKETALIHEALNGVEYKRNEHPSHARAEHLNRLNDILGTYGVEGALENFIDIQYCNAGDTYAITLLYWRDALWIGSLGDAIEIS